ncbi:MAG: hypothetical protein Q6J33_08080 [Gloeomargarita sp. DG_2_bins_126]
MSRSRQMLGLPGLPFQGLIQGKKDWLCNSIPVYWLVNHGCFSDIAGGLRPLP